MEADKKSPNEEVLLEMYRQTWQQYVHEDQLAERRDSLFLSLQLAAFAAVAAVFPMFFAVELWSVGGILIHFGLIAFSLIAVCVSAASLVVLRVWSNVAEAGRLYVRIRHSVLLSLEKRLLGMGAVAWGPATIESDWRDLKREVTIRVKRGDRIRKLTLPPYNDFGGFTGSKALVGVFRRIWMMMIAIAVLCAVGGALGPRFILRESTMSRSSSPLAESETSAPDSELAN